MSGTCVGLQAWMSRLGSIGSSGVRGALCRVQICAPRESPRNRDDFVKHAYVSCGDSGGVPHMGTALLKQASSEEGVEAVGQQWGCVLELGSSCCLEFACAPGLHGQVHKVPDACIATDL
eukprot:137898-Pelagomonas_calceolata.AAC.1